MRNLSKFQLITLAIFILLTVGGVIAFSFSKKGSQSGDVSLNLKIWGFMPSSQFAQILSATGLDQNKSILIAYEEKNKDTFDIEFLEALADGNSPDMFFLDDESLLKYKQRIYAVPFSNFPELDFKSSFVEAAEILLTDEGIIGFPISIDPLVMYWNRDIFTSAGFIKPPQFWDEIYDLSKILTEKEGVVIKESAVPLGEFANINNAFEILSALIMQAGNPITERSGENIFVLLSQNFGFPFSPAERALSFYTEFSSPLKEFYSWNRSLPRSRDFFSAGDSALYLGLASELFEIQEKNPNLNFDVTLLPQSEGAERRMTYGKIEALVLNKQSPNLATAFQIAKTLSGTEAISALSQARSLPPVRRDLLGGRPDRAYMEVFYESAIISRNWVVPDALGADQVFRNMVESVTSGRSRPIDAVSRASSELSSLFR